jgi:hypothetical protein
MYDFYGMPPKTRQDLRDWLTSWLEKPDRPSLPLQVRGETYIQELGFRRAFHQHCVFRNLATNEYVWWVSEDGDLDGFPSKSYPDLEAMLSEVIQDYYIAWNLGSSNA